MHARSGPGQAPKQNGTSTGRHSGTDEAGEEQGGEDVSKWTAYAAPAALLLGVALLLGGGVAFKGQLRGFIDYFVEVVDTWGPLRRAHACLLPFHCDVLLFSGTHCRGCSVCA